MTLTYLVSDLDQIYVDLTSLISDLMWPKIKHRIKPWFLHTLKDLWCTVSNEIL